MQAYTMPRFSDYPAKLRASIEHPAIVYTLAPGYYASHAKNNDNDAAAVMSLNDGQIVVFKGEPKDAGNHISPVYMAGTSLAVPSGLVFVRFVKDITAESQRPALKQAGYAIDEVPVYAPNAAWVRDEGRDIATALKHIDRLEKLAHVENVEPQLLAPRVPR